LREGALTQEARVDAGNTEYRPVAKVEPVLKLFSPEDLEYLDESVHHYWNMTGAESSDESHGVAWKSRMDGDAIPYEAAYFEDRPLPQAVLDKLARIARKFQLRSA